MKKLIALILSVCVILSMTACGSVDEKQEKYDKAMSDYDAGNYQSARASFEKLGDYKDSKGMIQSCDYAQASQWMDDEEYTKAAQLFETLGDYEDSAEKMQKCRANEIDALLQGSWEATESVMTFNYRFDKGRFVAKLSAGGSSISNEGSYRVDVENQEIYVCYDYIIGASGTKTPNTDEQMLFTYTYDGETFTLANSTNQTVEKQS